MDRITLPNGITIESSATANDQISQEAFDLLNTYSAESILEAFVACENAGLFSEEGVKEFAGKVGNGIKRGAKFALDPRQYKQLGTKDKIKKGILQAGLVAGTTYGVYKGAKAIKNKRAAASAAESILAMNQ